MDICYTIWNQILYYMQELSWVFLGPLFAGLSASPAFKVHAPFNLLLLIWFFDTVRCKGNQMWQKYIKTNRYQIQISVLNEPVLFRQFYYLYWNFQIRQFLCNRENNGGERENVIWCHEAWLLRWKHETCHVWGQAWDLTCMRSVGKGDNVYNFGICFSLLYFCSDIIV